MRPRITNDLSRELPSVAPRRYHCERVRPTATAVYKRGAAVYRISSTAGPAEYLSSRTRYVNARTFFTLSSVRYGACAVS